jgi:hypothetical protein
MFQSRFCKLPAAPISRRTAHRLDYWRDEDGAVMELYEDTLAFDGVKYSWRASFFTDLDGERFVGDIGEVKPLEWQTTLRVVK